VIDATSVLISENWEIEKNFEGKGAESEIVKSEHQDFHLFPQTRWRNWYLTVLDMKFSAVITII
jgi:hypothetical protein